jgi:hypothetical protein
MRHGVALGRGNSGTMRHGRGRERRDGDVLIRVDNHDLVDDLCAHFVRSNFEATTVGGGMIEVRKPDTSDASRANREVLMHLEVWRVGNPGAVVEVVEV